MSKRKSVTPVPARVIREAFQSGALDPAKVTVTKTVKGETVEVPANTACLFGGPQGRGRGRLNPAFVKAFLDANPGTTYAEKSEAEVKFIEVPMFSTKTGRPVKALRKPIAEVRKAAGAEGKNGRLSKADLLTAALTFGSGKPAEAKAEAKASGPVKVTMV